jgi:hypothetical protein
MRFALCPVSLVLAMLGFSEERFEYGHLAFLFFSNGSCKGLYNRFGPATAEAGH